MSRRGRKRSLTKYEVLGGGSVWLHLTMQPDGSAIGVLEGPMNLMNLLAAVVAIGFSAGAGQGQSTATSATTPATSSSPATRAHARRIHRARTTKTSTIARESAGPSAPASDISPEQRAKDQALLQQQQARSAHAAVVTNQVVEAAQQRQMQQQNEVRIQDAPGPSTTGVVPGAGTPVAPVNSDDRIQDAPGPAQTLPKLPVTAPATSAPATTTPATTAPTTTAPTTTAPTTTAPTTTDMSAPAQTTQPTQTTAPPQ